MSKISLSIPGAWGEGDSPICFVAPKVETTDAFPTVLRFYGEGSEAVSRWGQVNLILRLSTGTSGVGVASAVGFIWNANDWSNWILAYASANAQQPGGTPRRRCWDRGYLGAVRW